MRILQVNHYYDEIGGAEVYFRSLARRQEERGHDVAVFASHEGPEIFGERLRVVRRAAFDIDRIFEDPLVDEPLVAFASAFRPEIVHVHNIYSFPASTIAALASIGVPMVMTLHDLSLVCTNSWCVLPDGRVCSGGPGRKCLERGCQTNAPYDERAVLASALRYRLARESFRTFVSPSTFVAEKFRENGFGPIELQPYWVEADPPASGGPRPEPEPHEPGRVLYSGRLTPEKGVAFLVEAMQAVVRELPATRLSILGGGVEEGRLRALAARLGLGQSVEFHGRVSHDEVLRYLERAAVQAVPSIWCENSPVSCYESLVAGLPIVASRIGGIPDLVRDGETGLLAEPRDPADLAQKLLRVLREPELRARLSAGCRQAAARYTDRAAHLERIDGIYRDTLARANSVPASTGWEDILCALQGLHARHAELFAYRTGGRVRRVVNRMLDGVFAVQRRLSSKRR